MLVVSLNGGKIPISHPKFWSFLVGKPMVFGVSTHHLRKHPYVSGISVTVPIWVFQALGCQRLHREAALFRGDVGGPRKRWSGRGRGTKTTKELKTVVIYTSSLLYTYIYTYIEWYTYMSQIPYLYYIIIKYNWITYVCRTLLFSYT